MAAYQPEDVRADLLYLRKGPGFTDERLAARPALVAVLGGPSETPAVLRERLESAIQSLHDLDAELLMAVYALDEDAGEAESLAARRDAVGRLLGIGREAVADRDAAAVERLLHQLITGWYPKSPTGIRIPESHSGFVQHLARVSTRVVDGRHAYSAHQYRLFALYDGVEYLQLTTATAATPIPIGSDFQVKTKKITGGYLHQFWHREPMKRGQTYDLAFRFHNPDPADPQLITEESLALHEPTRFVEFKVSFAEKFPATIWAFEGLTAHERPGAPTTGRQLTLTEHCTAEVLIRDRYGGLYCGMAWDWYEQFGPCR